MVRSGPDGASPEIERRGLERVEYDAVAAVATAVAVPVLTLVGMTMALVSAAADLRENLPRAVRGEPIDD